MTSQEPKNTTKEYAYTVVLVSMFIIFSLLLYHKICEMDKQKELEKENTEKERVKNKVSENVYFEEYGIELSIYK